MPHPPPLRMKRVPELLETVRTTISWLRVCYKGENIRYRLTLPNMGAVPARKRGQPSSALEKRRYGEHFSALRCIVLLE